MASNIFRQINAERGIFRNESMLLPDFLPDELPCRERQLKEIAHYLSPAMDGKAPAPFIMSGVPGTGKTSMAKLALKQLCEVSGKPLPVFLNCWEFSTRAGILAEMVSQLGGMLPRRGIASDEVIASLRELARKTDRVPIVVLDEVDRLVASREEGVLYDLARAGETFGMKASAIAITNDAELMSKLDARIRSSLSNRTVEFPPYTPIELKKILNERGKMAFYPDTCEGEVVPLCAAVAAKNGGDARIAISLLWAAGKRAEREGAKKIGVPHVQEEKERAVESAGTPAERKKDMLDGYDRKLVELIGKAGRGGIESSEIYSKMRADEAERRTIRNRLVRLEGAMLIKSEDIGEGSGHGKKYVLAGK